MILTTPQTTLFGDVFLPKPEKKFFCALTIKLNGKYVCSFAANNLNTLNIYNFFIVKYYMSGSVVISDKIFGQYFAAELKDKRDK